MTTPETRARIRAVEQRLTTSTPAPLDGQAAIPLTWRQATLWEPPRPQTPPAVPKPAQRPHNARLRRLRLHIYEPPARPATRAHGWYTHGRRIQLTPASEKYL